MSITEILIEVLVWVGVAFVTTTIGAVIVHTGWKILDFFDKSKYEKD